MAKLPSFPFYPGVWLKDPELRVCSKAAKGMWVDMLCLMFECGERGVLISGDRPWSDQEIAGAVSGDTDANLLLLAELLSRGVAKRNRRGAICCARMVRDETERQLNASRQKRFRKTSRNGESNGERNASDNADVTIEPDRSDHNEVKEVDVKDFDLKSESLTSKSKSVYSKLGKIGFDREILTWTGITANDRELWRSSYPAVDLDIEMHRAAAWVIAAGPKGFKSNWRRFLNNWFRTSQDRGGSSPCARQDRAFSGKMYSPRTDPKRSDFSKVVQAFIECEKCKVELGKGDCADCQECRDDEKKIQLLIEKQNQEIVPF